MSRKDGSPTISRDDWKGLAKGRREVVDALTALLQWSLQTASGEQREFGQYEVMSPAVGNMFHARVRAEIACGCEDDDGRAGVYCDFTKAEGARPQVGTRWPITCHIVALNGEEEDQTLWLKIVSR